MTNPERLRLLVIDDDREIAEAVALRLRLGGYDVSCAHDGEAGVEAANQQAPSAIVLDVRMPKLNGFEVLTELQEHEQTKNIPVIVLSASAVDEGKALDFGAYCFLPKPFNSQELASSIEWAIKSRTLETPQPADLPSIAPTNKPDRSNSGKSGNVLI